MATIKSHSFKSQKLVSSLLVNGVLILICLVWIVPALGILITSFRESQDIFTTGWWTIFPHQAYLDSGEIHVDPNANLDGPISIAGVTGQYTFEQLRASVVVPDGRKLTWFGNKRTLLIKVASPQWVGF